MLGMCYNNASMKTLAKNANDFASVRTMDKGGLRLIGPARTGRSALSLKTVLALKVDANPWIARMWLRGLTRHAHADDLPKGACHVLHERGGVARRAFRRHQDRCVAFRLRHSRIVRPVSRLNIFLKKGSDA